MSSSVREHASAASPPPPVSSTYVEMFDAEIDYVFQTLRRLGVRPTDLEDLAQDVFIRVYTRFDRYDPTRPVRPWLFGFCRRAAANYRRLARHWRELPEGKGESASAGQDPESAAGHTEEVEVVHATLERMPEKLRVALILSDLDGLTAPEIAELLTIPIGTVYSRVSRARECFRELTRNLLEAK